MEHIPYSIRKGLNPNSNGLPLAIICELFAGLYSDMHADGYFHEAFGFYCVDAEDLGGTVKDPSRLILLKLRKTGLWPIDSSHRTYSEHDLLDMVELLYQYVSKPIRGREHSYNNCGTHWETFNKGQGQTAYRAKVNDLLSNYHPAFELVSDGYVVEKADAGTEQIFEADVISSDSKVSGKIEAAIRAFRQFGASVADKEAAVIQLINLLEYLKPQVKLSMIRKDEAELLNIANNFALRHHDREQKDDYDKPVWLNWMFYVYLATVHAVNRVIARQAKRA